MAGPGLNVPNPGNPAQQHIQAATPTTLNVPNPANPAQQQINPQQPRGQSAPVGQPGGSAPPAAATTAPAAPATTAPAPVTVDPRDAAYYDQVARLNNAYQGVLANTTRTTAQDQANYNLTYGSLAQKLPLTQQATRNTANAQGLLESGILGQRADLNNAAFLQNVGTAQNRQTAADQAAQGRLTTAQNNLSSGDATALDQAIARAAKNDVSNSPTTPTTTATPQGRLSWQQLQSATPKPVTAAQRARSNAASHNPRRTAGKKGAGRG